jgi:hypothetical protein
LIGTTEYRALGVIDRLRGETCPELEEVLQEDDIFVDLGIGVDLGYNDYFLVASKAPVEPVLIPIIEGAEAAILAYEGLVTQFTSPEVVLTLFADLAGE